MRHSGGLRQRPDATRRSIHGASDGLGESGPEHDTIMLAHGLQARKFVTALLIECVRATISASAYCALT
jgi:hypothetical protein